MHGPSSSSSPSKSGWTYDVFLNFRGDTRKKFTDHLYNALVRAGIHTFRDDEELPRGEEISPQLLKAIQESRICIVVFSEGYASSTWCLEELEKIMECKNANAHQIVLPVFYNIDPSNVKEQKGSFAEAFELHGKRFTEEMEKVKKWRKALEEAADLSGYNLNNMADGHESKFIQKIVEDVRNKLDHKPLFVAKHPVGIDRNVYNIVDLLSIGTNNVCFVGLYGMPGIGKTALAKALFNQLCYGFEGCCFLFNVKDKSERDKSLAPLQKQLLYDILKSNCFDSFHDECSGVNLIKERLSRKRVLIVVDDVDQLKQLEFLVGQRSWFGYGSRIIITTRDEHLLAQFEVDKSFKVEELNEYESRRLFSLHAFRDNHPAEDFVGLSREVVGYCQGLPLALEVLGSSLFKRSKEEWKSTIEKLREIPPHQIQEKLQISFDSLKDPAQEGAFLDIACFFIGWDKEYVTEILDGRRFYADSSVPVLLERSLVTINDYNQFDMHDLIRDMGREIVRKMSPEDPGKRSRIWFHEDALGVLNDHSGTEVVKGLKQDGRESEEDINVRTTSFREMRHLELLQLLGVHLRGSYEHLSKELIWLCWLECPLEHLPSNFQLDKIIVLDIQHSNLQELWQDTKSLKKLKILNLSYSKYLVKTPNFHRLPKLKRIIMEDCPRLLELDRSIEHLEGLVLLNLKGCCRLNILPESMGALKSLETLNIAGCSKLEKLPECLGDLVSLTELIADGTAIRQLPSSIGHLKNLKKLSLAGINFHQNSTCTSWLSMFPLWLSPSSSNSKALLPTSFFRLTSLVDLDLRYSDLSEGLISSTDLGSLSSLERLDLSGNKFFNLPSGIGCLPKLQTLQVNDCTNLLAISELPSSLKTVEAVDCTSMESVSLPSNASPSVWAGGCQNLIEVRGVEGVSNSWYFSLKECSKLSNDSKKRILQELCKVEEFNIVTVGGDVPEWFSHRGEGHSVSFKVPDGVSDGTLEALLVWVIVCMGNEERFTSYKGEYLLQNKSNDNQWLERSTMIEFEKNYNEPCWVGNMTLSGFVDPCAIQRGDELELFVSVGFGNIKKCGIHMIVERPDAESSTDAELSTDAGWKSSLIMELQKSQICNVSANHFVRYGISREMVHRKFKRQNEVQP